MAFPAFKLEAAFGTDDPFAASPSYTDISDRLLSAQWSQQRQRFFDIVQSGRSNTIVDNSDRAFEAGYSGSPFYPDIVDGIRLRLSANLNAGGWTPLFTHYLDDILPQWETPRDQVCTLIGLDAFELFNLTDLTGLFPQQNVAARLGAVLDKIGWPSADRNIQTGGTGLPTVTFTTVMNQKALQHMQLASDSRPGILMIDATGKVVSWSGMGPGGALPSSLGPNGVDFSLASNAMPRGQVYNVIRLSCTSPALTSTQQDSTSIGQHQRRMFPKTVLATTQAGIDAIGAALLSKYKWPYETFDRLGVFPVSDAGWALVMAVAIGKTATLDRHSDVGTDYSQTVTVHGFDHTINLRDPSWKTTLRCTGRQIHK